MQDLDFQDMSLEEIFFHVETMLKSKGLHHPTETWAETAVRIKPERPEVAEILFRAQKAWDDLY